MIWMKKLKRQKKIDGNVYNNTPDKIEVHDDDEEEQNEHIKMYEEDEDEDEDGDKTYCVSFALIFIMF